ncbi:hypothetical protein HPB48_018390 [Haemaphysalis longicornis]|uniref:Uncharacterized protein n=1 Tax=Haemaphysalis longicornis TaxID=44386 RepID=A0A9J6GEZ4_HAELO|nr:hypothetical protein HPB48_018390 [Haemaphysalis longicornis]
MRGLLRECSQAAAYRARARVVTGARGRHHLNEEGRVLRHWQRAERTSFPRFAVCHEAPPSVGQRSPRGIHGEPRLAVQRLLISAFFASTGRFISARRAQRTLVPRPGLTSWLSALLLDVSPGRRIRQCKRGRTVTKQITMGTEVIYHRCVLLRPSDARPGLQVPLVHASWTRLLTDVIPGLRTSATTPETTLNETRSGDLRDYDDAVQDLLDSILAAHNLPSDSSRRRGKRSTSLDISIKDSLGE